MICVVVEQLDESGFCAQLIKKESFEPLLFARGGAAHA
jgi:hypothetical protein